MDLEGRVALVTGAARGLGRAIALALADAGCDVAVSDIGRATDGATPYALASGDDLAATARAIEQRSRRTAAVPADVTSSLDVARLMETVAQRLGGLDILVANAGVIAAAPVAAMDEAQWDRIFAVNVKGVFLCARAAIPLLGLRGGGRIVNVASVAGKTGRGGLAAYCASKAAVISLTQALAEELGPMNIAAAPVAAMDEAQWDRIFAVNVKGVFLCARAAIPLLSQRGGGRIVNIASVAGKTGRGGLAAYCASKAAVISLTQALAEELGPMNIAVNALCPGYIKTAMWTEVLNPILAQMFGVPADRVFEEFVQRSTYLKREQTPEEIADAAVYLCRAENVTGITLTVAGGGEVH